ncbi:MAG: tungstate transport system substrate-binding protein [Thermoleophilaceae bacterium]|nr:tungstate transport system substrate-binding protein [Thermoleophilaceae bacterium]
MATALALPVAAMAITDVVVQGTTDTRDAGLVDDVLVPGFEAAYPQYNLQYIAVGTGQALTNARAGQGDAVLTHAPTLEATFVNDGFSLEPVGRQIFYSDYIIAGRASDPAGVMTGSRHDAVKAFERIAAAGDAGDAEFISRGDNSGTNVQEKIVWAKTTGIPLNSSGEPAGPGGTGNPPWYHKVGAGQAATVINADQCNYSGRSTACYDMTDRGTFNRLIGNHSVTGLVLVSDKNDGAGARGGANLQFNPFSAYVVNPAAVHVLHPSVTLNVPGAMAFVDYLTSPEFQARLASYPNTADPAFVADARPALGDRSAELEGTVDAGDRLTVSGTLSNRLPGSSALGSVPLTLRTTGDSGVDIDTTRTNASGQFSFQVPASRTGAYQVAFPRTGRLSAATYDFGSVSVRASVEVDTTKVHKGGKATVVGTAAPSTHRSSAALLALRGRRDNAQRSKDKGKFRTLVTKAAKPGKPGFRLGTELGKGEWDLRVRYSDPGAVVAGESRGAHLSVR